MNGIIDDTVFTETAIFGTTLEVASDKLKVRSLGITSNELASNAVITAKIADGAVTQAKASDMLVPVGAVMAFAMSAAPTGWLACGNQAVSRATYLALFEAIGTVYGAGDESTTFNLPELRGYFVRGFGTNSDTTESGAFGVKQVDAFKSHSHGFDLFANSTSNGTFNEAGASGTFTGTGSTYLVGGGETRPKNIAMLYCIKY
jgi:microcystin-dependent protein